MQPPLPAAKERAPDISRRGPGLERNPPQPGVAHLFLCNPPSYGCLAVHSTCKSQGANDSSGVRRLAPPTGYPRVNPTGACFWGLRRGMMGSGVRHLATPTAHLLATPAGPPQKLCLARATPLELNEAARPQAQQSQGHAYPEGRVTSNCRPATCHPALSCRLWRPGYRAKRPRS